MRRLAGLLGGKNSVRQSLKELLNELSGDGVSSEVWDRCRTAETLEDFIEDGLPRERLVAIAAERPKNVYRLAERCHASIAECLALEGESFDDPAEISLANSMTVLCHLLAAGPTGAEGKPGSGEKPPRPPHPIIDLLWEPQSTDSQESDPSTGPSLAELILSSTMRALFFDGFTVDLKDKEEAKEGAATDVQNDVDPSLLWRAAVGPEGEFEQEPADEEMLENRTLALQLLMTLVCGAAPAVALKELAEEEAKAAAAKPPQRGRTADRGRNSSDKAALSEAAAAASQAMARPLIMDLRALAYLQSPDRSVPYRGELLYSLVSVSLDYNPRGMGVPLAGLFRGSKNESFISLSMQVLGLLLQDNCETECPAELAIVSRCPQELLGQPEVWPLPSPSQHVFRELLSGMTSEREVSFMFNGIVTLFGAISEEQRAYLPGSVHVPSFLPELLVLVFHLAGIDGFVKGSCRFENCGAPALAEVLVAYAFQESPQHIQEDIIPAMAMAALLRLTAYREFCDQLNEVFDGDQPDALPEFKGNFADFVALAALKQAADQVVHTQVSTMAWCVVEAALCTLDNISTFAEGLCMESCFRLFALLERCGKAAMVKRGRNGLAIWMPRILEAFQNALQYQYGSNTDMVYGLMTRQAMVQELEALVAQAVPAKAEESLEGTEVVGKTENGHSAPADGSAGSASASTSNASAPEMSAEWWATVKARLEPISMLLREVTPHVEAEVERREIASPEEAKKFLPRTALGFMPVPHAFVLRSLRGNATTHNMCEHCLVASIANGPIGGLWEESEESSRAPEEPEEDKRGSKDASARKRSSSRRARSVSRTRGRDNPDRSSGDRSPRGAPRAKTEAVQPAVKEELDPGAALKAQLEAAAAAGVDVQSLLQQLSQGATAASASPPEPASSETDAKDGADGAKGNGEPGI